MKKSLLTIAIAMLVSSSITSAQEYTLQYKPKKGSEYNYVTAADMSQSMNQPGGDFGTKISNVMKVTVVNSDKNSHELKANFSKAVITTKGLADMAGIADTTRTVSLIDQVSVNYKIDRSGRIVSEEQSSLDTIDMALEQFKTNLEELNKVFFIQFPTKALKIGEQWTQTTHDTNTRGGGMYITTTQIDYTLDGISDTLGVKCARVQAKSSAITIAGGSEMQGMKMTIDGEGTMKSTHYIELSTGMPVASKMSKDIDARMVMSGQQNSIMPIQTYVTISVARVKK